MPALTSSPVQISTVNQLNTHKSGAKSETTEYAGLTHERITKNGQFSNRKLTTLDKVASFFSKKDRHNIDQQRTAQIELAQRRIHTINIIDPILVAKALDHTAFEVDQTSLTADQSAVHSVIDSIASLKKDESIGKKFGDRKVINKKDFERINQKDIHTFLQQTINAATTPHALVAIKKQLDQISHKDISADHQKQLTNSIKAKLKEHIHEVTKTQTTNTQGRLDHIHELTLALKQISPKVLEQHKSQLKKSAIAAHESTRLHLAPHVDNPEISYGHKAQLEDNFNNKLAPIVELTGATHKSTKKLLANILKEDHQVIMSLESHIFKAKNLANELSEFAKSIDLLRLGIVKTQNDISALQEKLGSTQESIESKKLQKKGIIGYFKHNSAYKQLKKEHAQIKHDIEQKQKELDYDHDKIDIYTDQHQYKRSELEILLKNHGTFLESLEEKPITIVDIREQSAISEYQQQAFAAGKDQVDGSEYDDDYGWDDDDWDDEEVSIADSDDIMVDMGTGYAPASTVTTFLSDGK